MINVVRISEVATIMAAVTLFNLVNDDKILDDYYYYYNKARL